jgi:hypothetical protein
MGAIWEIYDVGSLMEEHRKGLMALIEVMLLLFFCGACVFLVRTTVSGVLSLNTASMLLDT